MKPLSEQLQQLPQFDPPPGGWPQLARVIDGRRRRARAAAGALALAASLLLAWTLTLTREAPPTSAAPDEIARLMQHSRELEGQLAQVRPQVAAWSAPLARRAQNLQNDLTVVDLQLNYAQDAGAQRLWQDRVQLMSQLVQTHQQAAALPLPADDPVTSKEISL